MDFASFFFVHLTILEELHIDSLHSKCNLLLDVRWIVTRFIVNYDMGV
jgi:hypothetical protein